MCETLNVRSQRLPRQVCNFARLYTLCDRPMRDSQKRHRAPVAESVESHGRLKRVSCPVLQRRAVWVLQYSMALTHAHTRRNLIHIASGLTISTVCELSNSTLALLCVLCDALL